MTDQIFTMFVAFSFTLVTGVLGIWIADAAASMFVRARWLVSAALFLAAGALLFASIDILLTISG